MFRQIAEYTSNMYRTTFTTKSIIHVVSSDSLPKHTWYTLFINCRL